MKINAAKNREIAATIPQTKQETDTEIESKSETDTEIQSKPKREMENDIKPEREKQEKVFPRGTLFLICPKRGNFGLYFPNMENIMRKSQDVVFKTRSIPGEKY